MGKNDVLVEGLHYYIKEGKWVFTSYFLSNRGYCCRNRCLHCPYGFNTESVVKTKIDKDHE